MGKQVFILKCNNGNAGVAKIISNNEKTVLNINLNKHLNDIKKCNVLSEEKIIRSFDFRKNKNNYEFLCDKVIDQLYLTSENESDVIVWSGERPKLEKDIPDHFTFKDFFGGGFEWQKIRGNFIMQNYSIIHYLISDESVYRAINKAGYYVCGTKNSQNIKFVAIAVSCKKDENPFDHLKIDNYVIESGKNSFYTVCTGIDETGEFFVCI